MMTPEQEQELRERVVNAEITYRHSFDGIDGITSIDEEKAEDFVVAYVNAILAEQQAEIERLKADIRNMSDVGLLFDGHDECNEETHEENSKLMESALARIHVHVNGKTEESAE